MSTAATIISRSMRLLGQLSSGSTPTTDEYSDGLTALNAMQDSWRNDGLTCYATQTESLTLSASTSSYAIGPTGTLSTIRPLNIEGAFIVDSNVSYDVAIITDAEYDLIPDKTTTSSWPDRLNYRGTMSNGALYVWPVPNATRTLKLRTHVPLSAFSATTDTVTLPPGWEDALAYNLAVRWAPEFQVQASTEIIRTAQTTLNLLKRVNARPIAVMSELVAMFNPNKTNILLG